MNTTPIVEANSFNRTSKQECEQEFTYQKSLPPKEILYKPASAMSTLKTHIRCLLKRDFYKFDYLDNVSHYASSSNLLEIARLFVGMASIERYHNCSNRKIIDIVKTLVHSRLCVLLKETDNEIKKTTPNNSLVQANVNRILDTLPLMVIIRAIDLDINKQVYLKDDNISFTKSDVVIDPLLPFTMIKCQFGRFSRDNDFDYTHRFMLGYVMYDIVRLKSYSVKYGSDDSNFKLLSTILSKMIPTYSTESNAVHYDANYDEITNEILEHAKPK